ncbi:MAG: putative UDP-3-O-[3-hydroxymyristoyl] glucosamine N-acyltransferase [Fibrobacteres bacterium]|nr:putative UDP-3-O-[3-hydroxymyristoyl] glucosamine N-acyltransferase [Fibrobacterota bacterium]
MRFAALRLPAANQAADAEPGWSAPDSISAADILRICSPFLAPGSGSPESSHSAGLQDLSRLRLSAIDPPDLSGPDSLTFLGPRVPLRVRASMRAALVVAEPAIEPGSGPGNGSSAPVIRVHSLPAAMAAVLTALESRILREAPYASGSGNRIAPGAVVEGCLEGDVTVGAGAYIGKGSFIGSGTVIGPNAVIQEHCRIGRNCVVQAGAVIGCAGFGFYPRFPMAGNRPELLAMPHPAGVEIGDDCWIGAQTVIAAGVLHPTILGRGCKLDSHVQIAHNVRLGDGCLLASQSGIAGSTVAGHRLRMGGASSVDGHLRLGDDVSVAACSGVTKDFPDGATVAGFPAMPIREWRRQWIKAKRSEGTRED